MNPSQSQVTIRRREQVPIVERSKVTKDATKAQELLPVEEGLFFGGTDYDEWYLDEIKETKCTIEQLLADGSYGEYYTSSW